MYENDKRHVGNATSLGNTYVCGYFPTNFFDRSKHPICPTNDK